MSGFGALDFMNKTLKNNRGLIKKINVFERIKPYNSALKDTKLDFKNNSSDEAILRLREQTIADNKRNTLIQILKLVVVLLLLFAVIAILIGVCL